MDQNVVHQMGQQHMEGEECRGQKEVVYRVQVDKEGSCNSKPAPSPCQFPFFFCV